MNIYNGIEVRTEAYYMNCDRYLFVMLQNIVKK